MYQIVKQFLYSFFRFHLVTASSTYTVFLYFNLYLINTTGFLFIFYLILFLVSVFLLHLLTFPSCFQFASFFFICIQTSTFSFSFYVFSYNKAFSEHVDLICTMTFYVVRIRYFLFQKYFLFNFYCKFHFHGHFSFTNIYINRQLYIIQL